MPLRLLWLVALLTGACGQPSGTARAVDPTAQARTAVLQAQMTVDAMATARPQANTPTPRPTATAVPPPTATLPIPTREELARSLIGQTVRFCRDRGVAFDGTIEQAYVLDHVLDGLRIDMVVRATNVGTRGFGTFQLTMLEDERGRRFDQAGLNERISGLEIADKYGVDFHGRDIAPGFTGRQGWSFVVATDVRRLTVIGTPSFPCPAESEAPAADQDVSASPGLANSLVGQGFRFCRGEPISFDLAIERVDQRPAQGGIQVIAVVRATNTGSMQSSTARMTEVIDDRGRRYAQSGAERGIDIAGLAQAYGAARPAEFIAPGQTARHVWVFVVPADAKSLTLVERELFSRCSR
jgi:hypothetical protein